MFIQNKKSILSLLLLGLIILGLFFLFILCRAKNTSFGAYGHTLKIGNQTLMIDIANTEVQRAQGLSNRPTMAENQGMLFDFSGTGSFSPAFWMKDMNFNLDLIWIKNNKIIGITPDVPKPIENWSLKIGNLPLYYSPAQEPIDMVLEVNANWCQKNNIKVGDEIKVD